MRCDTTAIIIIIIADVYKKKPHYHISNHIISLIKHEEFIWRKSLSTDIKIINCAMYFKKANTPA
jgi:hypothetical protein